MIHLLYLAQEAKIGIVVRTSNRKLLRQRLYKLQKKDPILADLAITFPDTEDELWIMKKSGALEDVDQ